MTAAIATSLCKSMPDDGCLSIYVGLGAGELRWIKSQEFNIELHCWWSGNHGPLGGSYMFIPRPARRRWEPTSDIPARMVGAVPVGMRKLLGILWGFRMGFPGMVSAKGNWWKLMEADGNWLLIEWFFSCPSIKVCDAAKLVKAWPPRIITWRLGAKFSPFASLCLCTNCIQLCWHRHAYHHSCDLLRSTEYARWMPHAQMQFCTTNAWFMAPVCPNMLKNFSRGDAGPTEVG